MSSEQQPISELIEHILSNYIEWMIFPIIFVIGHFVIKTVDKYVSRFFDNVQYDRTLEVIIQ